MDNRSKEKRNQIGEILGSCCILSGTSAACAVSPVFAPALDVCGAGQIPAVACAGVFEVPPAMRLFVPVSKGKSGFPNETFAVTNQFKKLMERAAHAEAAGAAARLDGDEAAAEVYYREALGLALNAAKHKTLTSSAPARLEFLRAAAGFALHCGEAAQARQIIKEALLADPVTAQSEAWLQLRDVTAWPDVWLIATVRCDPPDEAALDALVARHWRVLFGRCQMLTLSQTNAADLAQEAWRRVLRTRHRLNPGGRFAAYLITIATNLWRDTQRSAGRAGALAQNRLASLDDTLSGDGQDTITLMDVLPDLQTSQAHERRLLAQEIDHALGRLTPLLREVLTARFLSGESCAEIGRRHGRTEQTVSGWVRTAIQQMKIHLAETTQAAAPTNL